ncbi:hypothetical protein DOTSEDRAFT_73356 [Dothistroma septosporum NZE10]|uniref:C3H1-type domain-containing protein n=1 Tax=Dothistroma septosporum (strain NZE10 / CBS 128990) TaxID=675120 RepID=N1PLQ7_DOTSN|nr:hypothetical protein DOTSEDRAFT_73356 [Dothistroma septosporum NZE10]
MNDSINTSPYAARLEACRRSDDDRNALVEELIKAFEDLKQKHEDLSDDHASEVASRRRHQAMVKELETTLVQQRQAMGSNNFAMVLIDGDGAIFQDALLQKGDKGGVEAAHLLHAQLQHYLKDVYPDANVSDWSIVVHVVLNLGDLSAALSASGITSTMAHLAEFGRGFGAARPLFNFIDVGRGKERADHKIRESLRLYLPNAQCRHVFFGPCHDNGYINDLAPYSGDTALADRLTLIETRPAEPGFLGLGLKRMKVENVFRDRDIPKPGAPSMTLPLRKQSTMQSSVMAFSPGAVQSPSPARSSDEERGSSGSASSSWAAVGKNGVENGFKTINIAPKKAKKLKHISFNAAGQRIDEALPKFDVESVRTFDDRVKKAKTNLCNQYHLNGHCGNAYCTFEHGAKLTLGELLVLKHKSRGLMCSQGTSCDKIDCYLGHHCKFQGGCTNPSCRFSDTHGMVDLTPVSRWYEDGTEEYI